jgi:hypothetical protein
MVLQLRNTNVETALKIASLGFKLSRCIGGTKIPAEKDWPGKASNDPDRINYWFAVYPNCNISIVTESIVVVDVDSEGLDSFSNQEYASLLAGNESGWTPMQRTPNGGLHFFFKAPDRGQPWRTLVNVVRPGVDIKTGPRSCVMCEPSFLADENTGQIIGQWKFEIPLREIHTLPSLPDWLYSEIERHQASQQQGANGLAVAENAGKSCMYYFKKGGRNNGLTHIAGKLRYYYQIRDEKLLAELLLAFNKYVCDPPLPPEEVIPIARSLSRKPLLKRKVKPH